MKVWFLLPFVGLLVGFFLPALADDDPYPWKAAVAKTVITPKEPVWMSGYAGRKGPSESVLQDIHAKALALEDAEGGRMVFVTLDLIGVPKEMRVAIEKMAMEKNGLKPEQLLINASHTHSGPMIRVYAPPKGGGKILPNYEMVPDDQKELRANQALEYRAFLQEEIGELITKTLSGLKPCRVDWSHARCGFSMNRRTPLENGSWKNFPNPDAPVDQEVPVLQVRSREGDKELIAVMFGYACHATTLGTMQIHGDWPGFAQTYFERDHPGTIALFLNGASGDQNPYPRRIQRFVERHGQSMSTAIEAALKTQAIPITGPLRSAIAWPEIAYQEPPSREELVKRAGAKKSWDSRYAKFLLDTLDEKGLPKSYPIPVQVVRFGNSLTLAAIGGEVVVDYSLRLKKELAGKSGGAPVWFAGYTNDVMTYIPSRRVLEEGGYEGGGAMIYIRSSPHPAPWVPEIEDRLVETAHRLFDELGVQ